MNWSVHEHFNLHQSRKAYGWSNFQSQQYNQIFPLSKRMNKINYSRSSLTWFFLLRIEAFKFLHRNLPLAMSTKVQNPFWIVLFNPNPSSVTLRFSFFGGDLSEASVPWKMSDEEEEEEEEADLQAMYPARIAERKTRMNLRGHIGEVNLGKTNRREEFWERDWE